MWQHRRGYKKRGTSSTFRSPNISSIIGGSLAEIQVAPNKNLVPVANPLLFSGPVNTDFDRTNYFKARSNSVTPRDQLSKSLNLTGYKRDLNQTCYMDDNQQANVATSLKMEPSIPQVAVVDQKKHFGK